jgi:hypothetical protein
METLRPPRPHRLTELHHSSRLGKNSFSQRGRRLPREPGWSVKQGAPGATSCSSALRNALRTFPRHHARGAGIPLHYRYRDHALAWPCRIDRPGSPPLPRKGPDHHNSGKGARRKAQGVKAINVLNEFRVSGTTRCASACAASRTRGAIEHSFLIPNPPPLAPATFLVRLCPSMHTFFYERMPSGHSGERAITSRPLVRASGRTCESNHYAALPNRPARLGLPCIPVHGEPRSRSFSAYR